MKINIIGYTYIETLVAISLLALLSGMAVSNLQPLLEQYYLKQDANLLVRTLEAAKTLAMLTQTPTLCSVTDGLIIVASSAGQHQYALSGKNRITLARFPSTSSNELIFTPSGHTASHNGTFTITSQHGIQINIVFNQGGRIYSTSKKTLEPSQIT